MVILYINLSICPLESSSEEEYELLESEPEDDKKSKKKKKKEKKKHKKKKKKKVGTYLSNSNFELGNINIFDFSINLYQITIYSK